MNNMRIKAFLIIASIMALSVGLYYALNSSSGDASQSGDIKAVVYKSPTCGCCGVYASYLKRTGIDVSVIDLDDMTPIKEQYGISPAVQSCHTTVIGDYFIEGHIPVEAIRKVLSEKPNIKGIALPGMPSGSPGMPGPKQGTFDISALSPSGEWEPFMSL
jgi:hypothetical protein